MLRLLQSLDDMTFRVDQIELDAGIGDHRSPSSLEPGPVDFHHVEFAASLGYPQWLEVCSMHRLLHHLGLVGCVMVQYQNGSILRDSTLDGRGPTADVFFRGGISQDVPAAIPQG